LAGTLLFYEKSAKVLLCFGLDCGMLEFFTHQPLSKEQLMSLQHFWITVRRKRSRFEHMQAMILASRRLDAFLHEAAQNFELLSNIQEKKSKSG
jgi:hypothetical protein